MAGDSHLRYTLTEEEWRGATFDGFIFALAPLVRVILILGIFTYSNPIHADPQARVCKRRGTNALRELQSAKASQRKPAM